MQENKKYYDEIDKLKRRQHSENRAILEKQIQEDFVRREKERLMKKELYSNNYGP